MPGTKAGGMKAAAKNLQRNPNFYKEIGSRGGKNSKGGGFARWQEETPEEHYKRVSMAGKKGGRSGRKVIDVS